MSGLALEFAQPYALLALLAVPFVLGVDVWFVRRRGRRVRECLGARVARRVDAAGVKRRITCTTIALVCALAALAGPRAGAALAERAPVPSDTVVCLDVSRSMLAGDTAPTRLAYAQRCIEELVARSPGERFALVVFAGEARVRAPSTADGSALLELLAACGPDDVAVGGTDLGAALELAGRVLAGASDQSDDTSSVRNVLLATDGEDHGGAGLGAAARLFADGVRVGVLGLGSERGAKIAIDDGARFLTDADGVEVVTRLDVAGLEALAEAGGGEFRAATGDGNAQELALLFETLTRERLAARPLDERASQRAPVQSWFVAAALAALLFGLPVGSLVRGGRP